MRIWQGNGQAPGDLYPKINRFNHHDCYEISNSQVASEKERLKFNSLLDIEKEGARELAFKAEEKQLNEQATIQFNLKNKS